MRMQNLFLVAASLLIFFVALAFITIVIREAAAALHSRRQHQLQTKCIDFFSSVHEINDVTIKSMRNRFSLNVLIPAVERIALTGSYDRLLLSILYEKIGIIGYFASMLRKSSKWNIRAEAAIHLGKSGCKAAVQPLVETLLDPNEDPIHVKVACARALEKIADPHAIPDLIRAFSLGHSYVAASACTAVASFGSQAVENLLEGLRVSLPDNSGMSDGVGIVHSQRIFTRLWIIRVLGMIRDGRCVPSLIEALSSPESEERICVIEALGNIKDKRALYPLKERVLYDPMPSVRTAAAKSLSMFSDSHTVEMLLRVVTDPDTDTGICAVDALEMLGPEVEYALRNVLSQGRPEVRRRAAEALERMGNVYRAIQDLVNENKKIRLQAQSLLEEVASTGAFETIAAEFEHEDFSIRARLCTILGRTRRSDAADLLFDRLGDPEWPVQAAALEALEQIEVSKPWPVEKVIPLIRSESEEIRLSAVRFFAKATPDILSAHVAELSLLAEDANREIRMTAISLLGSTGSVKAVAELAKCLSLCEVEERTAVCVALGRTGRAQACAPLKEALRDTNNEVCRAAVIAFGEFGQADAVSDLLGVVDKVSPLTLAQTLWELSSGYSADIADRLMESNMHNAQSVLIRYLAMAGDDRAARLAEIHLDNRESPLIKDALDVCGITGRRESIPRILPYLEHDERSTRYTAIRVLGDLRATEAVEPLLELLNSEENEGKEKVLISLGKIAVEESAENVSCFLDHEDAVIQAAAVVALCLIGKRDMFPMIIEKMAHPRTEIAVTNLLQQQSAIFRKRFSTNLSILLPGVSKSGVSLAEAYRKALESPGDAATRARAATALGMFDESGIAPLKKSLEEDPDEQVRVNALDSLVDLLPADAAAEIVRKTLSDPSSLVKIRTIELLGDLGIPQDTRHILHFLKNDSSDVLQKSQAALVKLNNGDSSYLLDRAFAEQDPGMIENLCPVISKIDMHKALPVLEMLLQHTSDQVRVAAAREIAGIGGESQKRTAEKASNDPCVEVRLAYIDGLNGRNGYLTAECLTCFLNDPAEQVREKVQALLVRTG